MMKRNLIYLLGVVCLMASCVEENTEPINPTPGRDVRFAAEVGSEIETRTLYGADNNTAIKVHWVDGDKITVYGTTGGKQRSDYTVKASTTPIHNQDTGQNYADDLVKTEENGVQWGEEKTATFAAIYPADANATFSDDGETTIKTTISAAQNYLIDDEPTSQEVPSKDAEGNSTTSQISVWKGTHFDSDATKPSMQSAFMYARTAGATNGDQVDLHFKPFTTVLKFRFMGFSQNLNSDTKIYIESIKVTAPASMPIAGDFNLTVKGTGVEASATATAAGNNSNSITITPIKAGGSYLTLAADEAVEFEVFTLPIDGYTLYQTSEYWTVNIKPVGYEEFTYKLKPTVTIEEGDTDIYALAPGKIHKVKVPAYKNLTAAEWDPTKWITQIPKPVYLSEISVPGAWYCMDDGYQGSIGLGADALTYSSSKTTGTDGTVTSWYTTSSAANGIDDGLEHLYYNGIRAFNIDCRITRVDDQYYIWSSPEWNDRLYDSGSYNFVCAGTENVQGINNVYVQISGSQLVSDVVKSICSIAQAHRDEYVAIIFTFAEKPSTMSTIATDLYGSVRADYITAQLNAVLNTAGIKEYLYTGITPDTTIDDVLTADSNGIVRNVIVKINHPNVNFATSTSPSFSMPSGIMASFGSMAMSGYIENNYVTDITTSDYSLYYKSIQSYPIYNGKTANDMTYYYHQAQKTESSTTASGTTYPSVYDRLAAVDDVLEKATTIYDNSSHDALFQLGIGGSIDDEPESLAQAMNEAVRTKIEAKLASDPSPVGFVLMNYAADATYGLPLVKDIITMNGKFYLKREGSDIVTGNGSGTADTGSESLPTANAAYAYVGENAF